MTLVHSGKSPDAKAEPEKETAAYAFKLFTTLHHGKCLAVPARCADWSSFLGSGKQKPCEKREPPLAGSTPLPASAFTFSHFLPK